MPCDYRRYPADWHEISRRVREKAGQKCERCGAPNGEVVVRAPGGFWSLEPDVWHDCTGKVVPVCMVAEANGCEPIYAPDGGGNYLVPDCRLWRSRVVLTVAHLGTDLPDGTPGNKHDKRDVREENLAALCQSCHLRYDHADHIRNARETRMRRKAVGPLPGLEG